MSMVMKEDAVELVECIGQVLRQRNAMNLLQLARAVPYGLPDIASAVERLVELGRVDLVPPIGSEPRSLHECDARVYFRWKRECDGQYRWQVTLRQSVDTDRPTVPRYAEACL